MRPILSLFAVLLLAACGQAGPLYLPDDEAPPASPESQEPAPDARKRDEQAPAPQPPAP